MIQVLALDPPFHLNLALAYRATGADAQALEEMKIVLQLDPGDEEAAQLLDEWQTP
jgi:Tfp pilus assembly protein PilF